MVLLHKVKNNLISWIGELKHIGVSYHLGGFTGRIRTMASGVYASSVPLRAPTCTSWIAARAESAVASRLREMDAGKNILISTTRGGVE